MQLEISNCYSPQFSLEPIQLYENIGKSKCLHLLPKITYSILNFSKQHSCVLGLQFKQCVKALGL